MSSSPTYQRLTAEALEQHEQIHFFLDQILVSLSQLSDDLSETEPMRRLAAQLQGFRERLQEHHEAEEQGGLFLATLELLPEARQELRRLRQQHQKMIEILEMARIHAQFGEPREAPALRQDLQHFLELMREHEQLEETLLKRAVEREKELPEI